MLVHQKAKYCPPRALLEARECVDEDSRRESKRCADTFREGAFMCARRARFRTYRLGFGGETDFEVLLRFVRGVGRVDEIAALYAKFSTQCAL